MYPFFACATPWSPKGETSLKSNVCHPEWIRLCDSLFLVIKEPRQTLFCHFDPDSSGEISPERKDSLFTEKTTFSLHHTSKI
jgi:hypothetical protein